MEELANVFTPEIRPAHKVIFSVAAEIKLTSGELTTALAAGNKLAAGRLLTTKSGTGGDTILSNPTAGASITVADGKAQGVLAHDIKLKAGVENYMAGIIISGVVYDDVMKAANANTAVTAANKEALAKQNLLFYNVKTIKG